MNGPIPKKDLEFSMAVLCRRVAAVWLGAMSYREVDFEFLADRTGEDADKLRSMLHELVDGKSTDLSFRLLSFVMSAMDMRMKFELTPRSEWTSQDEKLRSSADEQPQIDESA